MGAERRSDKENVLLLKAVREALASGEATSSSCQRHGTSTEEYERLSRQYGGLLEPGREAALAEFLARPEKSKPVAPEEYEKEKQKELRGRLARTWDEAAKKWQWFLQKVESKKKAMGVTDKHAWFRGLSDTDYELLPSLVRYQDLAARHADWTSRDTRKEIERLAEERRRVEVALAVCSVYPDRPRSARERTQRGLWLKHNAGSVWNIHESYLELLGLDEEAYRRLKRDREKWRDGEMLLRKEKELFHEYRLRASPRADRNDWDILAEMRHYGVPTRLMDWTEELFVALYFALDPIRRRIEEHEHNEGPYERKEDSFWIPTTEPEPCLWILNPYHLLRASGLHSIVEVHRPGLGGDYHDVFLDEEKGIQWKFEHPIPILPPWSNRRIQAQRGFFTVHGRSRAPLDSVTFKHPEGGSHEPVCTKVPIERDVAAYGVRFLAKHAKLDEFTMWTDFDSLGRDITKRSFGLLDFGRVYPEEPDDESGGSAETEAPRSLALQKRSTAAVKTGRGRSLDGLIDPNPTRCR